MKSALPRLCLLVLVVLAVPIVPFLIFQDSLEPIIESWLAEQHARQSIALAVVGLLAVDVALPIPSSFISTFAGAQLGIGLGTLASWFGMSLGATFGFAVARWLGRPLAERWASLEDLSAIQRLAARFGTTTIVITSALPVLAEASVLALGAMGLSWRRFLPAMLLSNFGIALAYAVFGALAREQHAVLAALVASIVLPLAATLVAQFWLKGIQTRAST